MREHGRIVLPNKYSPTYLHKHKNEIEQNVGKRKFPILKKNITVRIVDNK